MPPREKERSSIATPVFGGITKQVVELDRHLGMEAASVIVLVVAVSFLLCPLVPCVSFPREASPALSLRERGPASKLKVCSGITPRLVNAFLAVKPS